jgi:hypothetical protein
MKKALAVSASALLLATCSTFMRSTLDNFYKTESGQYVHMFGDRFSKVFDESFGVSTKGFFDREDAYSLEPLCIFFPGWATVAEDMWQTLGGENQLVGMLNKEYKGRIWIINSPTNASAQDICEKVEQVLSSTLEQIHANRDDGRIPEIHAVAHSYGSVPLRYYIQKHPYDMTNIGFVGCPIDGVSFEPNFVFETIFPYILTDMLVNNGKEVKKENLQSGYDIIHNSPFLREFNKSKPELFTYYTLNFFGIDCKNERSIIPGKDDRVVPLKSAMPISLLEKHVLGYPWYGDFVVFKTTEDHHSCLRNETIVKEIVTTLRYGPKNISRIPPTWNDVRYEVIPDNQPQNIEDHL